MKNHLLFLLIISISLLSCSQQEATKENNIEITTTENKNAHSYKKYYIQHYSINPKSETEIQLDQGSKDSVRYLKIGESLQRTDHHLNLTLTLKKITDTGANFSYQSKFDHRSFGKNLIEKDQGEFFISWTLE